MRRLFAPLLVAAALLPFTSCVGLFDLDGHEGVAGSLCDLLITCEGEPFPGCSEHVGARLEIAAAADREAYLRFFGEELCGEKCLSALACLDHAPVCAARGEACTDPQQCCGFLDGSGSCDGGRCCKPKGLACESDEECCAGLGCSEQERPAASAPLAEEVTLALERVCGGERCAERDQPCSYDVDCCSDHCVGGACAILCQDTFCEQPDDCCSGDCVAGFCQCRDDGASCKVDDQCCDKLCLEGICIDTSGCANSGESCQLLACCDGLQCQDGAFCCDGAGEPCIDSFECCSSVCFEDRCCKLEGDGCNGDGDCCVGFCNESALCACADPGRGCDQAYDCCAGAVCLAQTCVACQTDAVCHDPCKAGDALLTGTSTERDCPTEDTIGCVAQVCATPGFEYCCCTGWDAGCVELYQQQIDPVGNACKPCVQPLN